MNKNKWKVGLRKKGRQCESLQMELLNEVGLSNLGIYAKVNHGKDSMTCRMTWSKGRVLMLENIYREKV